MPTVSELFDPDDFDFSEVEAHDSPESLTSKEEYPIPLGTHVRVHTLTGVWYWAFLRGVTTRELILEQTLLFGTRTLVVPRHMVTLEVIR